MMDVPGLYPRAKGKEKLECNVEAGLQQMAHRIPKKGQGLLAALKNQPHQPANLTETGQATGTAGEQIKQGHILQPAPPLPIPHSLVSNTPQ